MGGVSGAEIKGEQESCDIQPSDSLSKDKHLDDNRPLTIAKRGFHRSFDYNNPSRE